jgi:hypothetical protein
VTFFVMYSVEVQVTTPAGTFTISPSLAKVSAEETSIRDALFALMSAAFIPVAEISNTAAISAVNTAAKRAELNLADMEKLEIMVLSAYSPLYSTTRASLAFNLFARVPRDLFPRLSF